MSGTTVTTLTPHQSDSDHNMDQLTSINVSDDAFAYTLPAQSITTFVRLSGNSRAHAEQAHAMGSLRAASRA
jgi:O-glycosyl hydrolase